MLKQMSDDQRIVETPQQLEEIFDKNINKYKSDDNELILKLLNLIKTTSVELSKQTIECSTEEVKQDKEKRYGQIISALKLKELELTIKGTQ